jgi:hypothetical protein
LGHYADRHELPLNGVEFEHRKADCGEDPQCVFLTVVAARINFQGLCRHNTQATLDFRNCVHLT